MLIKNARAYIGHRFVSGTDVRIADGVVQAVGSLPLEEGETLLDADGRYLIPGFVDVHIHAVEGHDTMRGEADVRAMARTLRTYGVAAFLPTTMSATVAETRAAVEAVARVMAAPDPDGSLIPGVHMEAPFLAESKCGAQRKECFMDPSMEALEQLTGGHTDIVRVMTMAPERSGSEAFIRTATEKGIVISLGHTAAGDALVHESGDWGANHITHTFNAQTALHHREPGVPGAALVDDRFFCEMICDGLHLHPDIIRLIVRCKTPGKAVMITDAMEAAGMPDGMYSLGGQPVTVHSPEARLADGTIAGSVLTMPLALKNMILRFGFRPEDAVQMCTQTPAGSIHEPLLGHIAPGSPVPLTLWSGDWTEMRVLDA